MTAPDPRAVIPPWSVVRGDAFNQPVTIRDASGTPINLTTYGTTFAATLRRQADDTTTVAFTINTTNAATGGLVFSLSSAQTAAMNNVCYFFDIQISGGTVTPQTPFKGSLLVVKDFTP